MCAEKYVEMLSHFFQLYFLIVLLEYSCFSCTTLCWFLLYNEVNQLCAKTPRGRSWALTCSFEYMCAVQETDIWVRTLLGHDSFHMCVSCSWFFVVQNQVLCLLSQSFRVRTKWKWKSLMKWKMMKVLDRSSLEKEPPPQAVCSLLTLMLHL